MRAPSALDRRSGAGACPARVRGAALGAPPAGTGQGALARAAARHGDDESACAHHEAQAVAPVRAHRGADARRPRDRRRHVQRSAHAPTAARRRRERQDDRRAVRGHARDRERVPGRGDGADRASRRAACAHLRTDAAAARHLPDAAHRLAGRQGTPRRRHPTCERGAGAGRRDARAGAGIDDVREARACGGG